MEAILNDMRARMPWAVASRIIKSVGAEPSQGWQRTIENFRSRDDDAVLTDRLLEAIGQYNLCGEKFVKIHVVDEATRKHIEDMFV